ncbi:MAG: hypothetical protein QXS10_02520 [Candidatus Bathyarchaeia archaeon]
MCRIELLVDIYQKGWALRCLREAIDEIKIVQKDSRAIDLIFDALRKVQIAVYYSLGEPLLIDNIVNEVIERALPLNNPVLKYLIDIKKFIGRLESALYEHPDNISFRELDEIISMASKIINLMTSLCAED